MMGSRPGRQQTLQLVNVGECTVCVSTQDNCENWLVFPVNCVHTLEETDGRWSVSKLPVDQLQAGRKPMKDDGLNISIKVL